MVIVAWILKLLKLLEGKYIVCIAHMYVFVSQQQVKKMAYARKIKAGLVMCSCLYSSSP